MDKYDLLVTIHIMCAIGWVGGSTFVLLYSIRALDRGDKASVAHFVGDVAWDGPRFFIPISLLTIVFGALSVWDGPWSFSDPWVSAALGLFVVSFLVGAGYLGPQSDKLAEELVDKEPDDPTVATLIKRVTTTHRLDLILLYTIVVIMVFKPT